MGFRQIPVGMFINHYQQLHQLCWGCSQPHTAASGITLFILFRHLEELEAEM